MIEHRIDLTDYRTRQLLREAIGWSLSHKTKALNSATKLGFASDSDCVRELENDMDRLIEMRDSLKV